MNSESTGQQPTKICHVVAFPYPGRGHVNPMMNFCRSLASKRSELLITFVVTEEWLGLISSDPKPSNLQFGSIPNVIPSERVRGANLEAFIEAVMTKMEAPFERLLDRLDLPPTVIISDTFLCWTVGIGIRRNIPLASFWTMSSPTLSILRNYHLFDEHGHFPVSSQEQAEERVTYVPGISSTRLADIPYIVGGKESMKRLFHEIFSLLLEAKYLLCVSIYELEAQVIDVFRKELSFPVYAIGPAIPTFKIKNNGDDNAADHNLSYLDWLDRQPNGSVLYVSFGSFLSVSSAQMDELAMGLCSSGVRFLWVTRGDTDRLRESFLCSGEEEKFLLVPWCDQLKVLSHSSVGGFWSHCGWNSTREGVFCGVPFLAFPLIMDQLQNSRLIVEEWKVGCRVKRGVGGDDLVMRDEIGEIVREFMDLEGEEQKEMRRRARELKEICHVAVGDGGSSTVNIDAFIRDVSQ